MDTNIKADKNKILNGDIMNNRKRLLFHGWYRTYGHWYLIPTFSLHNYGDQFDIMFQFLSFGLEIIIPKK